MLTVSIYRYHPELDAKPYMQDFQIDTGGKDLMVLDVLNLLKMRMQIMENQQKWCPNN